MQLSLSNIVILLWQLTWVICISKLSLVPYMCSASGVVDCRLLNGRLTCVFWEEQSTFTFLEQWGLTWNGRNTAWSPCCASLSVVNLRNYHWRKDTSTTIIWKDEESVGQNWKALRIKDKTWYTTSGESQSNISTFCTDVDFGARLEY